MLVIGTAGNEKSIHTMFDELTSNNAADKVLSFGLLWGVYMGSSKPKNITMNKLKRLVENHIDKGVVFRDIKDLIKRNGSKNELFCFFPIWGTGNFIFDLIESIDDSELKAMAELYLDHQMRLRHVFTRAGLPESAIIKHISSLDKRKNILSLKSGVMSSKPEEVFTAQSKHFPLEIRIIYGDITSRSLLEAEEFQALGRGIISSDDTCISAGGGVAFQLLNEAGLHNILNELAKFSSPIEHGTVVVTSGGKLPVQYILHAAAVKIEKNATYKVSKPAVRKTMRAALDKASALAVGALWVPLMGAGVASLPAEESLEGILEAIAAWGSKRRKAIIMIVIYREKDLPRHHVYQCLLRKLKSRFSIHNI
jgi:O-acetyl-ADP-ribose deacetylase (regulator of RNase III)